MNFGVILIHQIRGQLTDNSTMSSEYRHHLTDVNRGKHIGITTYNILICWSCIKKCSISEIRLNKNVIDILGICLKTSLDWLRSTGKGYQARMNNILRQAMLEKIGE